MISPAFLAETSLQYELKHARDRIRSFESGEEYKKMEMKISRLIRYYERVLEKKNQEIEKLQRKAYAIMEMWFKVFQDIQEETGKKLEEKNRLLEKLQAQLQKNRERQRRLMQEATEARAKANDEKEKNQKLQAQVNQNFENSSIPSSQNTFRGKVTNNRESTGRSEGGQPGHEGHKRNPLPVTEEPIFIDAPDEIKNNPDYYRQSGPNSEIHKQVIGISLSIHVQDYWAYVYRNRITGAKYHAPFPDGVQLDVNYDESIKSIVFLLRNHLNVSIDKTSEFIREMTDGKIRLSHGMVSGINNEFSRKTQPELGDIFARLSAAKVMYTDMTCVRHNGKIKNVVICSDKTSVYYAFRDKKGDEGLKGTPVEYFVNLLVHDHDKTFYHYGSEHQDCNYHHTRYLRGAIENEPLLKWHGQMLDLLCEMESTREKQERKLEPEQVEAFIKRYDAILDLAGKEYYDNPPSRYYRKGYNLYKEMRDYKDSVLKFLINPAVDFGNNEAERCARKIKRHTVVSGSFRGSSNKGGEDYCNAMSVLQTDRRKGENIFEKTKEYFKRTIGRKAIKETINPAVAVVPE